MYDTLTRQITRRLSQNLRRPLAVATPLGRQLLDGLRSLRADEATDATAAHQAGSAESAAAAAGASNLAGWGLRNPCAAQALSAGPSRPQPARAPRPTTGFVATPQRSSEHCAEPAGLAVATQQRPAARAARCTVDPIDARRTVISGRMSDVCDALDRLIALQAAQSAQSARFAI